jgi:hypothetical protein
MMKLAQFATLVGVGLVSWVIIEQLKKPPTKTPAQVVRESGNAIVDSLSSQHNDAFAWSDYPESLGPAFDSVFAGGGYQDISGNVIRVQ